MQAEDARVDNYFHFAVGGQPYAVALSTVSEVLFIAELSLQVGQTPALAGYLNRRGDALPIYHMAKLLHLTAAAPTLYDHILVMKLPVHGVVGFLTEGVQKIRQVSPEQIVAAPAHRRAHQPPTLLQDSTQFVPILDLNFLHLCLSKLRPAAPSELHLEPLPSHVA